MNSEIPSSTSPGIELGSPDRFGFEWATYADVLPEHRDQLQRWLGPVALESFAGRSVLDAGCGMGRNSYWVARAGAARVVSVDVDEGSLSSARRNLAELANVSVQRRSIYDLDPAAVGTFDRVMCIGVLHHLEHPELALERLWSIVAPGGELLLWCYGKEGNEMLLPAIEALRAVGSKLPIRATHTLAKIVTAVSYPVLRFVPWRTEYYRNLRALSYRNVESIIFDQMLPKTARYWTREEMLALLAPLGGEVHLERVQGNSWAARVVRTSSAPTANGGNSR